MAKISDAANATKSKISLGLKPPDKSLAWRFLPSAAKEALARYRSGGQFGGTPGTAPYWWAQNYGLTSASIKGQHFLENAMNEWRPMAKQIIRSEFKL